MCVGVTSGRDTNELCGTAVEVASEAAELVAAMREQVLAEDSVGTKSSETDVVTAADHAAERLVRARLEQLRPGETVLGEESAEEGSSAEAEASGRSGGETGELRWVVDPIDGTVNYLYGFPWYAVSVAAELDGRSVAGAVVEPVSGRVWSAAEGHGAYLGDRRLWVSPADRLDLALIGTGFAYSLRRRTAQAEVVGHLLGQVRDLRRSGAASLDLCAVAAGWLDGYYEVGLKRWDWAAGALIASEAGAEVRLPAADAADGLGGEAVCCAAPRIAEPLREALVRAGAADV